MILTGETSNIVKTKYDVFLSYSCRDSGIAKHLASKLEEAGVRCFMAEKDIVAGEHWESRILKAIHEANRMLLLITPRSKNSLWIAAEAGAAWALEKDLIAALMFVETAELIEPIRRHQARLIETPEQVEALINELAPQNSVCKDTINGQWIDPLDGDVVFFKQSGDRVVGFYDYGSGNRKVGVYSGTIRNHSFEYQWKWLNGQFDGYGRMTLSQDGKRLSGGWWYRNNDKEIEHVEYHRVSDAMPAWIKDQDFKEFADYLKAD